METFDVKGIDVSLYQDDIYTPYLPVMDYAIKAGFRFAGIRVGYGVVEDKLFAHFWSNAKFRMYRMPYWYLDYYSAKEKGYSSEVWGVVQARRCHALLGADLGELPLALDLEKSKYGPVLDRDDYNLIARAFSDEWTRLTGQKCLIYCSPGFMPNLYSWAKTHDLWLAWYNTSITRAQIKEKVLSYGFTGLVLMWQYSSSGPGEDMGFESEGLDLNVWFGSADEFYSFAKPLPVQEHVIDLYHPLKTDVRISQYFGANPQWYPTSKGHNGVDWACQVGTPIYAMAGGVVSVSRDDGKVGYGRHVRISHPDNSTSIYGHLSRRDVLVGDIVTAKQQIGVSGGATSDPNCGNSTGAHLHGELRIQNAPQVPGGYAYGAINILPLLKKHEEETMALYQISVNTGITRLTIRTGPAQTYPAYSYYASGIYNVYEESNGYGRVGTSMWISLNSAYVTKIPLDNTDKEKLDKLWESHPELH